jgi:Asp-tRNA(Asn)/Glu-tRNA(Gln) amidotransferase A subunit family amidase
MTTEITELSAAQIADAYRARTLSPVEVVDAVLARIEQLQPVLNAFVTVTGERAREQARDAERAFAGDSAELPRLFGVPVSVKDLENTAGVRTTYGSVHFADHVPADDAVIWARLKQAGAILIGKTATPEFGAAAVTESELTGITRNPWDPSRTAGGSSGGAAVAVATGMGPLATGSDGGGSIRAPASFCGVVGLKPSAGRIPFNNPTSAYEPVTITGPITRTVRDAAIVLTATHGPDPFDPMSILQSGIDFEAALQGASLRGLRIGYSPDLGQGMIARSTAQVVAAMVGRLDSELRARVTEVQLDLPDPTEYFFDFWSPFIALEQYEEVIARGGGSEDDYPFIGRARAMNALDFARTLLVERTRIHTAFARVFVEHDLLVWPTMPTTAFLHPGEVGFPTEIDGQPIAKPEMDSQRLTEAVSHAGYPAITVPIGFDGSGLPVGLQIAGPHGADAAVLRAAAAIEESYPWPFPPIGRQG